MKELSIKEKAKRFDEAIKVAADIKAGTATYITDVTPVIEAIFPELKESEDELTWLKRFIKEEIDCLFIDIRDSEDHVKLKNLQRSLAWLERKGEQNPAWSEEDGNHVKSILSTIECCKAQFLNSPAVVEAYNADIEWFNSIEGRVQPQPQTTWKPSEEMLQALYRVIPENTMEISEDKILLDKLYQGLKYGRVL